MLFGSRIRAHTFDGMTSPGVAVLSRDDESIFGALKDRALSAGVDSLVTFDEHRDSLIQLLGYEPRSDAPGFRVSVCVNGRVIEYVVRLHAKHFVRNTVAVLAAAYALGADVDAAATCLSEIEETPGRGNSYDVPRDVAFFE